MVESQPSKLLVAGSIPVSRSILRSLRELRMESHGRSRGLGMLMNMAAEGRPVGRSTRRSEQCEREADLSAVALSEVNSAKADVAQLAERVLGKDEVSSSILDIGSIFPSRRERRWGGEQGQQTPRWSTKRAARRWT